VPAGAVSGSSNDALWRADGRGITQIRGAVAYDPFASKDGQQTVFALQQ
jgi:hypothetical protein